MSRTIRAAVLSALVLASPIAADPSFSDLQRVGNAFARLSASPQLLFAVGGYREALPVGYGISAAADARPASLPFLYLSADAQYTYAPVEAEMGLSLVTFTLGPTIRLNLNPRLNVHAGVGSGIYWGVLGQGPLNEDVVYQTGAMLRAGLGVDYFLSSGWSLTLDANYAAYIGGAQTIEVRPGVSYHIPIPHSKWLSIDRLEFEELFPTLYRQYEDKPPGRAVVTNRSRFAVSDLSLELSSERARGHSSVRRERPIEPGESVEMALPMVLADSVLAQTETSRIVVECRASYSLNGRAHSETATATALLHDVNALRWDDDEKACLFVDDKDPSVLAFSGRTIAVANSRLRPVVSREFFTALCLFSGLSVGGIKYVPDPTLPYAQAHSNVAGVDFVKFPSQTLSYRAGDCDDLAVLYCALLESAGIEAALLTVPGHILTAFRLGMSESEARMSLHNTDELINEQGDLWVPVETTFLDQGFAAAWVEGHREWTRYAAAGQAALYPVRSAWRRYPPVGLRSRETTEFLAPQDALLGECETQAAVFVARELRPLAEALERAGGPQGATPRIRNRMAGLYVRYGLYEQAAQELEKALAPGDYFPALANAGQVQLLLGAPGKAVDYLERARALEPANPGVLLGLARAYFAIGEHQKSRLYRTELVAADPSLAGRLRGLDRSAAEQPGQSRSSEAFQEVVWVE